MRVPDAPANACSRLAGEVISTSEPPFSRNVIAASTLGPMLPFGNSPSAR